MKQPNRPAGAQSGRSSKRRAKDALQPAAAVNKNHHSVRRRLLTVLAAALVIALAAAVCVRSGLWAKLSAGLENTISPPDAQISAPGLTMIAVDVGQGDCTLLLCDGCSLLIDAGEIGNGARVLDALAAYGVRQPDYIVATHPHSDHIGGLPAVLDACGAGHVILPRLTEAQTPTSEIYRALLSSVERSGAQVRAASPGSGFPLGEAQVTILGPVASETENLNDMSVVLRVDYRGQSILLTGDMEADEEAALLEGELPLRATVLKVGHHGSDSSSSAAFLQAVAPAAAVIECGAGNDYGHPHAEVLARLFNYTDRVLRTDLCGTIRLTLDGKTIHVTTEKEP